MVMTQENKELLLKDLCARLPHRVIVQCRIIDFDTEECAHDHHPNHSKNPDYTGNGYLFLVDIISDRVQIRPIMDGLGYEEQVFFEHMCNNGYASVDCCKPYLRPMSDMTEKEKEKLDSILEFMYYDNGTLLSAASDYLNSIHVDYRGLIRKGLAIKAPEGMYEKMLPIV